MIYSIKNRRSRLNLMCPGSITIEAAYVMPIVISVIFSLIYLAFCLHDRCLLQGAADHIIEQAAMSVKHDADLRTGKVRYQTLTDQGLLKTLFPDINHKEAELEAYVQQDLPKGLFLYQITSAKTKLSRSAVTIEVEAKIQGQIPFFKSAFQRIYRITIKSSSKIHNPAQTLRCAEVILETGSNIRGVDTLKTKLKDLLSRKGLIMNQ